MKPKDLNKTNEDEVWSTLYGQYHSESTIPRNRVGDTVRISENVFRKTGEFKSSERKKVD